MRIDIEALNKMGQKLDTKRKENMFSSNTKFEQGGTKTHITFNRENLKTNAGRVKNIVVKGAHGFQKGANYLGKTFPGLKDQNTMSAIYGGGGGSSHKQHHHQHHKHHSNEQHIYIHHVQSSGHKKKHKSSSQSNPFDFRW